MPDYLVSRAFVPNPDAPQIPPREAVLALIEASRKLEASRPVPQRVPAVTAELLESAETHRRNGNGQATPATADA